MSAQEAFPVEQTLIAEQSSQLSQLALIFPNLSQERLQEMLTNSGSPKFKDSDGEVKETPFKPSSAMSLLDSVKAVPTEPVKKIFGPSKLLGQYSSKDGPLFYVYDYAGGTGKVFAVIGSKLATQGDINYLLANGATVASHGLYPKGNGPDQKPSRAWMFSKGDPKKAAFIKKLIGGKDTHSLDFEEDFTP